MTDTLHQKIFADRWFRFDRYETKGGYVRPALGAKPIEYEPWKKFKAPSGQTGVRQPYEPILRLAESVRWKISGNEIHLIGDTEQLICEWCSKHGLLGLLLHRVESVVLTPQLRPVPFLNPKIHPAPIPEVPVSTTFARANSGWSKNWLMPISGSKPGVYLRQDLYKYEMTFEKLSNTWGDFFPDVLADDREAFQYPTPFTEEFWRMYAEPAVSIAVAVKTFADAVAAVRLVNSRSRLSVEQAVLVVGADHFINVLASPARPMLFHKGMKGYGLGWACHSLLTSYAMMVMLDLASARVLECANTACRTVFVSKSPSARYCSPKCRGTVQMRKYRRKKTRIPVRRRVP